MKKNRLFIAICALISLFTVGGLLVSPMVNAQEGLRTTEALDQLFTIRAIKIDEEARSSLAARDVGLRKAQEYAYAALMNKIVARSDIERLPQLSFQEKLGLIRGIDYVSERRSGRCYLATVNICFEPGKVSALLASSDIPHVLGAGTGVLVIHGHRLNGVNYVFEKNNFGLQAWDQVDSINRLRSFQTLNDTLDIRNAVGYSKIAGAVKSGEGNDRNIQYFQSLAKKFKADEAVLITTDYDSFSAKLTYQYKMTASNLSGSGSIDLKKVNSSDLITPQQAVTQAFDKVLGDVDDIWRSQLLISSSLIGTKTVLLPTSDHSVMVQIEKSVKKLSLISDWNITEIGIPLSKASFTYRGREDQLTLALKLSGLKLIAYGDDLLLAPNEYKLNQGLLIRGK